MYILSSSPTSTWSFVPLPRSFKDNAVFISRIWNWISRIEKYRMPFLFFPPTLHKIMKYHKSTEFFDFKYFLLFWFLGLCWKLSHTSSDCMLGWRIAMTCPQVRLHMFDDWVPYVSFKCKTVRFSMLENPPSDFTIDFTVDLVGRKKQVLY